MGRKRKRQTQPEPEAEVGDRRWLLLLLPLLAVVGSLTLSYLWNEDFWWYVTSGRAILDHGGIPDQDPFLYTSGTGQSWVHHSWLWTVIIAVLERAGGLGTVVVFHALLALSLSALLYTTKRVDRWGLINALAVLLFLATNRHRLSGKTEVATWLLLIVFYRVLEHPEGFTWRRGATLAVLQVLWANLHGGFPLGIFLVLCYAVGPLIQERLASGARGRPLARPPPLWFPVVLFVLSIADPRMARERLSPFGFVTGSEAVQPTSESGRMLILEWLSPFSPLTRDPTLPWLFAIAAISAVLSFIAVRPRSVPRLLFFLGLAALAGSAVRHMSGLALASALVALSNLAQRSAEKATPPPKRRAKKRAPASANRRWLYPAACVGLAASLLMAAVALRIAAPGFDGGQSYGFFTMRPAMASPGAADYVLEHDLPSPIFNDYQLGAYLSYRLFPSYRLFVDSRVLDPKVVEEYTEMTASEAAWKKAQAKYGFQTAVLGNYSRTVRSPLGMALLQDPSWRLVYVDPLAVVFTRDREAPGSMFRLRLAEGDDSRVPFTDPPGLVPLMAGLQRVFVNDFPANYLIEYLAVLGQLGRTRDVHQMATEALVTMPEQPLLYRQRCAAELVLGNVSSAVGDCARAYELLPTDSQVTTLYCRALVQAGRRKEALFVLDEALRRAPEDPRLKAMRRQLGS